MPNVSLPPTLQVRPSSDCLAGCSPTLVKEQHMVVQDQATWDWKERGGCAGRFPEAGWSAAPTHGTDTFKELGSWWQLQQFPSCHTWKIWSTASGTRPQITRWPFFYFSSWQVIKGKSLLNKALLRTSTSHYNYKIQGHSLKKKKQPHYTISFCIPNRNVFL